VYEGALSVRVLCIQKEKEKKGLNSMKAAHDKILEKTKRETRVREQSLRERGAGLQGLTFV